MTFDELRERLSPRDIEEQPGCAPVVTLVILAAVAGLLFACCCFGVILAWWP